MQHGQWTCIMDMYMQHGDGNGHAVHMNKDMYILIQHGHGSATWTLACRMNINMKHGCRHALWTWAFSMDMDMHHGHGQAPWT
jgi:hypothetical protein